MTPDQISAFNGNLNLAPPLKVLAEHKSTREILADLSLFSVADVGFRRGLRGRWSEEGCSTPEYKKMGGRALPRLAINEVLPTNLLGFQGRLGFPGTDNLVQRPVARRRLWRILREHGAAESAEACPARHL